jgi:hypothetical protein
MTWLPSGIPSGPVWHPVWPPSGTLFGPVGHPIWSPSGPPSGTPSGPLSGTRRAFHSALCSSSPPLFAFPPDILIFSGRFCYPSPRPAPPSGTMIWSCRFGKRSSSPLSDLPRLALPSGTLVSSRGSGRPSISEPLEPCPFGPPTVVLPYTHIKPSTPQLHHFLHSPIRIGTCDCVATAALCGILVVRGWKQLLGANPFKFFSTIYAGEGWSLILSSPWMNVAATVTAREEEGVGAG